MSPQKMRQLRKKHGYTQRDVSVKLGVSDGWYGKWERGEVKPKREYLVQLARIYGVDPTPYKEPEKFVLRSPQERKRLKLLRKTYLDNLAKKYGTDGVLGNFDKVDKTDPDWIAYCGLVGGKVLQ